MTIRLARRWRTTLTRAPDSAGCRQWLRYRGSLTARIRAHGTFSLRLLQQRLALPTPDEAAALAIDARTRVHVREVALYCDGRIIAFAHTVLPLRPRGALTRWLARLGARSLGSLLFSHPRFARGEMSFCRIDRRHPLFAPATAVVGTAQRTLWARRSDFVFAGQRVLVTEVFAPLA